MYYITNMNFKKILILCLIFIGPLTYLTKFLFIDLNTIIETKLNLFFDRESNHSWSVSIENTYPSSWNRLTLKNFIIKSNSGSLFRFPYLQMSFNYASLFSDIATFNIQGSDEKDMIFKTEIKVDKDLLFKGYLGIVSITSQFTKLDLTSFIKDVSIPFWKSKKITPYVQELIKSNLYAELDFIKFITSGSLIYTDTNPKDFILGDGKISLKCEECALKISELSKETLFKSSSEIELLTHENSIHQNASMTWDSASLGLEVLLNGDVTASINQRINWMSKVKFNPQKESENLHKVLLNFLGCSSKKLHKEIIYKYYWGYSQCIEIKP